ncbi:hypothetical protein M1L60_42165 [Actinoplanes sp. TRM 88003]|uniref:Uncharacterized protein n=1 Tax=Paractinoplanes aksuensis TaxID=2939490 RepID=A0ABT1E242_9ACTN|nr:hypothetical protein [Actinoplanes aksuensis]MCO8277202.1 hypothetical protein [Actinoplanes aksuensis]
MSRIPLLRGLAVGVALGALAATAACSSSAGDVPASAPSVAPPVVVPPASVDPSVAAEADAELTGNTKEICAQAERASTSFGELFIAGLKLQIDAAGKGEQAKKQAADKVSRDVQNYSFALADMAGLTTDPTLKKALTEMSAQVKALKGDVTKINGEKMSALSARLDKACGRG